MVTLVVKSSEASSATETSAFAPLKVMPLPNRPDAAQVAPPVSVPTRP
jgi:hypothetical protein